MRLVFFGSCSITKISVLVCCIVFIAAAANPLSVLLQQLRQWLIDAPVEKVYLMTDKPLHATGETVWYRAWLVNGLTHTLNSPTGVLYVELLAPDGRLISQQRLRVDSSSTHGDIALADSLYAGEYLLRAYTSWMRNAGEEYFFSRTLQVTSSRIDTNLRKPPDLELSVALLPEGGELVSDLHSRVAVEVVDNSGRGRSVLGHIEDETGTVVAEFETNKRGVGLVRLTPRLGASYTAVAEAGLANSNPIKSLSSGVVLEVDGSQSDQINIALRSNLTPGREPLLLLAHVRGEVAFAAQTEQQMNDYQGQLPRSRFPAGLVHFTVFDAAGVALAERLVYNPPQEVAQVDVRTDKTEYGMREQVELVVDIHNSGDTSLKGDFALTVVDRTLVADSLWGTIDIRTWLLAGSDLAGGLSTMGLGEDLEDIDRWMMTRAWRRFRWVDLGSSVTAPRHEVETGFRISGQIVDNLTKRPARSQQLSVFTLGLESEMLQLSTDDEGRFDMGLTMRDSTDIVLQTWNRRNKRHYDIRLDPFTQPAPTPDRMIPQGGDHQFFQYLMAARSRLLSEREYGLDPNYRLLGEITVEAKRDVDVHQWWYKPTLGYDHTFKAEDAIFPSTNAADLLRGQPRVVMRGLDVVYIGNKPARILVDGSPWDGGLSILPAEIIDHIDIIWDPIRSMTLSFLGSDDSPIIAFYTKRDWKVLPRREGILNVRHPGYYTAREFHAPDYAVPDTLHRMSDLRSTLAWFPTVTTGSDGRSKVSFWSGDVPGEYRVRIEGLLTDGRPVVKEVFFTVTGN